MALLISNVVNVTVASTPYTPVKKTPPKGVKFKTPPIESEELDRFYDIVFASDTFFASWAGRTGHYPYDRTGHGADNQDGYIYLWPTTNMYAPDLIWKMSADSQLAAHFCREYIEINI